MKFLGIICMIGAILLIGYFQFVYDPSVEVPTRYIQGYGSVGGGRVVNFQRMEDRRNGFIAGCVLFIVGVGISVFASRTPTQQEVASPQQGPTAPPSEPENPPPGRPVSGWQPPPPPPRPSSSPITIMTEEYATTAVTPAASRAGTATLDRPVREGHSAIVPRTPLCSRKSPTRPTGRHAPGHGGHNRSTAGDPASDDAGEIQHSAWR